jgi:hypothetical protein
MSGMTLVCVFYTLIISSFSTSMMMGGDKFMKIE